MYCIGLVESMDTHCLGDALDSCILQTWRYLTPIHSWLLGCLPHLTGCGNLFMSTRKHFPGGRWYKTHFTASLGKLSGTCKPEASGGWTWCSWNVLAWWSQAQHQSRNKDQIDFVEATAPTPYLSGIPLQPLRAAFKRHFQCLDGQPCSTSWGRL